jgi:hypothetical protein
MDSQKIILGLCILAYSIQVMGTMGNEWSVNKDNKDEIAGLWNLCSKKTNAHACMEIKDTLEKDPNFPKDSLKQCQVLALLGSLFLLLGFLCMIFMPKHTNCASICVLVGAICAILAPLLYSSKLLKYKTLNDKGELQEVSMKAGASLYASALGGMIALGALAYKHIM